MQFKKRITKIGVLCLAHLLLLNGYVAVGFGQEAGDASISSHEEQMPLHEEMGQEGREEGGQWVLPEDDEPMGSPDPEPQEQENQG